MMIIKQVIMAICCLHSLNIVHRNLQPENVLLVRDHGSDINLKLCGLGDAVKLDKDEMLHEKIGTPNYVAPEVLK